MKRFLSSVVDFLKAEDGPTAVEYAVMMALVIVVTMVAVAALGANSNAKFNTVANTIRAAGS